jgi:vacuolar-type H+-ATPase subunit D/Vma8
LQYIILFLPELYIYDECIWEIIRVLSACKQKLNAIAIEYNQCPKFKEMIKQITTQLSRRRIAARLISGVRQNEK